MEIDIDMSLLTRIFNRSPAPKAEYTGLRIIEGVESTFNYHLAFGPERKALCDPSRTMMQTGFPLSTWGYRDHLPSTYCRKCEAQAVERKLGIPAEVLSA